MIKLVNRSETIGRRQNIECTASPILAHESTVRKDWDLNIHPATGGIVHPFWQIKGLFTAFESYGRWPSGLAKFEIDAEEDEAKECFEGDHGLYLRKMALQGVCHASGSGYETNHALTDTLTELAWEEDRDAHVEYIWNEKTEEWVLESRFKGDKDVMSDHYYNMVERQRQLAEAIEEERWAAEDDEDNPYRDFTDVDYISPLFDKNSEKYANNEKYRWVPFLDGGHWREITDKTEIERRARQVRWTHSDWVKAKCSPAAKICRCSQLKRTNRLGEVYSVFPKWKWCSNQPLFGYRPIDRTKLMIDVAHQMKFIPATLDGYFVEEVSEVEELTT